MPTISIKLEYIDFMSFFLLSCRLLYKLIFSSKLTQINKQNVYLPSLFLGTFKFHVGFFSSIPCENKTAAKLTTSETI